VKELEREKAESQAKALMSAFSNSGMLGLDTSSGRKREEE